MTHYLRNHSNEDLVDIETWDGDLSCVVVFRTAFKFVNSFSPTKQMEAIKDFENIQEIRGAYFEGFEGYMAQKSSSEFVAEAMRQMAYKYDLDYVVD